MISENGEGLIFLLSQPRSGSTLLQRMLAASPVIHTVTEPGIAAYPLYILRSTERMENSFPHAAQLHTQTFLAGLPEKEEAYIIALRKMLTHLYNRALAQSDKKVFPRQDPALSFRCL